MQYEGSDVVFARSIDILILYIYIYIYDGQTIIVEVVEIVYLPFLQSACLVGLDCCLFLFQDCLNLFISNLLLTF